MGCTDRKFGGWPWRQKGECWCCAGVVGSCGMYDRTRRRARVQRDSAELCNQGALTIASLGAGHKVIGVRREVATGEVRLQDVGGQLEGGGSGWSHARPRRNA